jgi:hypothetical protein
MPSRVHAFTADGAPTAPRVDSEDEDAPPGAAETSYSISDDEELAARRAAQIADAKRKAGMTPPDPTNSLGLPSIPAPPLGADFRMKCLEIAAKGSFTDPNMVLTVARNLLKFVQEG